MNGTLETGETGKRPENEERKTHPNVEVAALRKLQETPEIVVEGLLVLALAIDELEMPMRLRFECFGGRERRKPETVASDTADPLMNEPDLLKSVVSWFWCA
jgi:hypothetical protein